MLCYSIFNTLTKPFSIVNSWGFLNKDDYYSNCGTISNTILVEFITGSANASAAFLQIRNCNHASCYNI